jgi:hypothetical protein
MSGLLVLTVMTTALNLNQICAKVVGKLQPSAYVRVLLPLGTDTQNGPPLKQGR